MHKCIVDSSFFQLSKNYKLKQQNNNKEIWNLTETERNSEKFKENCMDERTFMQTNEVHFCATALNIKFIITM